ncbi:MAG: type III PLP-dependent enzyme [Bryobacteraceae bacterium]
MTPLLELDPPQPTFAVRPATPCLLMRLDLVEEAWRRFERAFPHAGIHYAVKANPAPEIIAKLAALRAKFDVASPAEVDLCLAAGASPGDLSYGNTVKRSADIAHAWRCGVRLFVFDCEEELRKIAAHAPGSRVSCRLAVGSAGSSWPLARKFGCSPAAAEAMLAEAVELGLLPWGVAFHVGSQQRDPSQWEAPIAQTAALFHRMRARGVHLAMINLGGGFPARYREPAPDLDVYGARIRGALDRHMSPFAPHVMLEPGRGLVADAGVLVTEVVLVSRRDGGPRWVYVDVGKFGGLAETMDECIQYRIRAAGFEHAPAGPAILAGPTCDSADILYEKTPYELPLSLREGDRLEVLSAGAYTASYASVGFNGFAPLPTYFE